MRIVFYEHVASYDVLYIGGVLSVLPVTPSYTQ